MTPAVPTCAGAAATVLLSRAAATAIFAEVRRWVDEGLRDAGSAHESLLYPLSALVPASALLCPVELVGAEHLRQLVIDDVAIPPDEVKAFSPLNCHFSADDMARANELFNVQIETQLQRRPRLGVHSKMHSHPFAGGAFLSGGDLHHGVAAPAAAAWREQRGLRTAILHVVYPDGDPTPSDRPWVLCDQGALGERKTLWRVRSWASVSSATVAPEMIDLGDAQVVPDRHPSVRAARREPYWRTRRGQRWCDTQKAALREAGYGVSRNLLGRGWRRYLLGSDGRQLLIALPPDLPATVPRVLEVRNAALNDFLPLEAPGWAATGSLSALSLLRLARHFLAPRPR